MSTIKWKNDELLTPAISITKSSKSFQCPIIESITFYLDQGFTKEEILELGKEEGLCNMDLVQAFDSINKKYMF